MLPRGIANTKFDTAICAPNCLVTPSSRTAESDPVGWLGKEWLNDSSDPSVTALDASEDRTAMDHCKPLQP